MPADNSSLMEASLGQSKGDLTASALEVTAGQEEYKEGTNNVGVS